MLRNLDLVVEDWQENDGPPRPEAQRNGHVIDMRSSSSSSRQMYSGGTGTRPKSSGSSGGAVAGSRDGTARRKQLTPQQKVAKEKKFLREVQDDLEDHRELWKGEVDKMMEGMRIQHHTSRDNFKDTGGSGSATANGPGKKPAGANSFIDTSTGIAIFKAFVDVSEYPASSISVTLDNIENKLVVQAMKAKTPGNVTRTFTQKVQLPRYADYDRVRTRISRDGIMSIEVPLLFYFDEKNKKSKSFINQVKTGKDGGKSLEILVNISADIKPWDLKIRVNERNELLIHVEKEMMMSDGSLAKHKELLKRYILPERADPQGIRSKLGPDGRLAVVVPFFRVPWD